MKQVMLLFFVFLMGCQTNAPLKQHPLQTVVVPNYIIGPGDTLNIIVNKNEAVSASMPVRPDGKISTPLVDDMQAVGKTPTQLARDIEKILARFIKNPTVTIIVTEFGGATSQQIRVVGAAAAPKSFPYYANMTLLDLMIEVGGLDKFAAGNRAKIIRTIDGERQQLPVKLDNLMKNGDINANIQILPGDILIVPTQWF